MAPGEEVNGPLPADGEVFSLPRARFEADEKSIAADISSQEQDQGHGPEGLKDFPWQWKVTALCLGLALSWGSSFSENTLGPLKGTLIRKLKITNAQVHISEHVGDVMRDAELTVAPSVWGYLLGHFTCKYCPPYHRRIWS